jgi:hypothetical protein
MSAVTLYNVMTVVSIDAGKGLVYQSVLHTDEPLSFCRLFSWRTGGCQ